MDTATKNLAPQTIDFTSFVTTHSETGKNSLSLVVDGMRCASCAWRIESELNAEQGVHAQVSLTANRLVIHWKGVKERGNELVKKATTLGFRFLPAGTARTKGESNEETLLLQCIAIAGFAAANTLLFSIALWLCNKTATTTSTHDLFNYASALISIPAILYAGQPYFRSSFSALRHMRANMDVPISLAVSLSAGMSLLETFRHGEYVYFDSATMLLLFLLIGRYLDRRARGRARAAAQDLLAMMQGTATIRIGEIIQNLPIRDILSGMQLIVATGEKIAADGIVVSGVSNVDASLITGETVPQRAVAGDRLFAGMVNISAPLELTVSAASGQSLIADIVRLMENAEQGQARYVRIADMVARYYTPVVHILALGTFLYWLLSGMLWQKALLIATTVLIITCPCALGLAVPVVQVVASGMLFRKAILLKSGDALERLAAIDTIVFDKTGTLTLGKPQLTRLGTHRLQDLQLAASLAAHSKHPLSRALCNAWNGKILKMDVIEEPGNGLCAPYHGQTVRLGRRGWCGDENAPENESLELWLKRKDEKPVRFAFDDALRSDAVETIQELFHKGFKILLLSGDRNPVVKKIAATLGIQYAEAGITPIKKTEYIQALQAQGRRILMVGDGLNDAPALTTASVSMSPSSAIDIAQNAADIVFQGEKLSPVLEAIRIARDSNQRVKQNVALAFAYNILAVPLAMAGEVTPLIAAIAMSSSSIIVILNALRLKK